MSTVPSVEPRTRDMAAIADGQREVNCIAKNGVIASARCAQEQENGCFCPAAYGALVGMDSLLSLGRHGPTTDEDEAENKRLRASLIVLRERATGFLRKPMVQRYAGPALSVSNRQRERQVAYAVASGEKKTTEADERRGALLEKQLRLKCSTAGCEIRLSEKMAATGDSCSACRSGKSPAIRAIRAKEKVDEREDEHEAAIAAQEAEPSLVERAAKVRDREQEIVREIDECLAKPPRSTKKLSPTTPESSGPEAASRGVPLTAGEAREVKASREPVRVVQPGPTGGRENRSGLSPCAGCGGPRERRNASGYCAKPECQRKHAAVVAASKPKCLTGGCTNPIFGPTGKCFKCQAGVRPGSGHDPCASENCPRRVQRWRGFDRCTYCRRGLTRHLSKPKEQSMPRKNPLAEVTDADFRAAHEKYGGETKALGEHFGASAFVIRRRVKALGLNGKTSKPIAPRQTHTRAPRAQKPEATVPAEAVEYAGLPPVDQVPVGYAKKLHEYLRSQGISFIDEEKAA